MTIPPETAWTEAADAAADRVFKAIGTMDDADLGLKLGEAGPNGTNSRDASFIDYLSNGEHLSTNFLANAK